MQQPPSSAKKLRAVTETLGIPAKKGRKTSAQFQSKVVPCPSIKDSTIFHTQIKQPNNNSARHRPQNSSSFTNRQDQLPNNRFIIAQTPQRRPQRQSRKTSDVPKGLPEEKYNLPETAHENKRTLVDAFKKQLINRDQYDHPLKYKIVNEQLGFNPQKIYKLKQSELSHIQEQYQKEKGMEYLREAQQKVRFKTEAPQTANKVGSSASKVGSSASKLGSKGKVQIRKRIRSQKSIKVKGSKRAVLQQLREQEDIMGKIVYQKVRRHLKDEKVSNDFKKRVHSEQAIDRALVDFLKLKIERAETTLKRV